VICSAPKQNLSSSNTRLVFLVSSWPYFGMWQFGVEVEFFPAPKSDDPSTWLSVEELMESAKNLYNKTYSQHGYRPMKFTTEDDNGYKKEGYVDWWLVPEDTEHYSEEAVVATSLSSGGQGKHWPVSCH
jgi:hypothetical protein